MKKLKSEPQNPKPETIFNEKNSNDPNNNCFCHRENDFVLVIKVFDIWICFEFRYSVFEFWQW